MEVRNHRIGKLELVWREDELVCPALERLKATVGADGCLERTHNGCAYGADLSAFLLCSINDVADIIASWRSVNVIED